MWGWGGSVTSALYLWPPKPFEDGDWMEYYGPAAHRDIRIVGRWNTGSEAGWTITNLLTTVIRHPQWQAVEVYSSYGRGVLRWDGTNDWISEVLEFGYTNYSSPENTWTTHMWYADYFEALSAGKSIPVSDTQYWSKANSGPDMTGYSIELVTEGARYELTSDGAQSIFTPSSRELAVRLNLVTNTLLVTRANNIYIDYMRIYDVGNLLAWAYFDCDDPEISPGSYTLNECQLVTATPTNWYVTPISFDGSNFITGGVSWRIRSDYYTIIVHPEALNTNHTSYIYGHFGGFWPIDARLKYFSATNGTLYISYSRGACRRIAPEYAGEFCAGCGVNVNEPWSYIGVECSDSAGDHQIASRVRHAVDVIPGWNTIDLSFDDPDIIGPHQSPPLAYSSGATANYNIHVWAASADKKMQFIRAYFAPK
jgi:hypothetical protein